MTKFLVKDERLWKGDQGLHGSLVGYYHDLLLRARIVRDSYDLQCSAKIETWTRDGWAEVQYVPIKDLSIFKYSPYDTNEEAWRTAMRKSLDALCRVGERILIKEVP